MHVLDHLRPSQTYRLLKVTFFSTNVVMNYTEIEAKVREATNDEPWGPTGQIMQELAHSTFTYEHFPEVMSMLWKRMLQDSKQHWRRTYKVSVHYHKINRHINGPYFSP